MRGFLTASLLASTVAAVAPILTRRQNGGCTDRTDVTCCSDGLTSCALSEYCAIGSDGVPGCCTIGEVCVGPGGINTIGFTTAITNEITITSVSTIFDTNTIVNTLTSVIADPTYTPPVASTTENSHTSPNSTSAPSGNTTTFTPPLATGGAAGFGAAGVAPALGALIAAMAAL